MIFVLVPSVMLFIVQFVNVTAYLTFLGDYALDLPLMCFCDSMSCVVTCLYTYSCL